MVSKNDEGDAARACLLLANVRFFWQDTEMVWVSLPLPGSRVMSHRCASLGLAVLNDMPFLDVALLERTHKHTDDINGKVSDAHSLLNERLKHIAHKT